MNEQPLACNLDAISADEQARHARVVEAWQDTVEEVVALPDGYAFRFAPESETVLRLAEFASRERLCCPFFRFEIVLEAGEGPLWLRLTGADPVKDYLREQMVSEGFAVRESA